MVQVETEDELHSYHGRWMGAENVEFPIHATYFAWVVFLIGLPLVWLLLMGLTPVSQLNCLFLAIAVDLLGTSLLRQWVSGDRTLIGLLQLLRWDVQHYLAARRAQVAAERAARPQHYPATNDRDLEH